MKISTLIHKQQYSVCCSFLHLSTFIQSYHVNHNAWQQNHGYSQPSLLYTKTKCPIISNYYYNKPFKLKIPLLLLLSSSSSCNNNSSTFSPSLPLTTGRRRTRHSYFLTFVFYENLPDDIGTATLFRLLKEVGNVQRVTITNGDVPSQKYATVNMKTVEEVEKAINKFNGYDLNGKLLTVSREKPKREQPKPRPRPRAYDSPFGICVTDLPRDIDAGRLEEIFSKHGKVESVDIKIEQFDESSTGYLIMANETDMNNVIAAFAQVTASSLILDETELCVYPLTRNHATKV